MAQRLTIVTWNINSLRLRQDLLVNVIDDLHPDVLCLQETKVPDELFPEEIAVRIGLPYVLKRGMKGYNGVAMFSRLPIEAAGDARDWCGRPDCRHVSGRVTAGRTRLTIHNFYVPAGGDVPDPAINDKYAHKLEFIAEARKYFHAHPPKSSFLVGDLNIAPLASDVWNHKQLLGVVSHTPAETSGLLSWQNQGFVDAIRHFVPEPAKVFTWWSYRNRDWRASDRGRRLDHVWVSHDLAPKLRSMRVLKDARDWKRTSDHVPVAVTVDV